MRLQTVWGALVMTSIVAGSPAASAASAEGSYEDLTSLFTEWRAFERPALRDGAPDYTAATLARKQQQLKTFQSRLQAIKPGAWPIPQQVDYHLLRAEMNGLDFDLRVLKPWERDPAFYTSIWTAQSDTPAHEGPTNHAAIEVWTYSFPLTAAAEAKLTQELQSVPPLLAQAQVNLVGNARDLWIAGIGTIKTQRADLIELEEKTKSNGPALKQAIQAAQQATSKFITWLEQQAPSKTGPSGVGKEHYTWSLHNVHLVPLTWDDEVMLLKRELARAHTELKLEEQRNRGLPALPVISSAEEFQRRGNAAVTKYMDFMRARTILPVKDYMDPAMRAHIGQYVPEETRNFFGIASHHEPLALYSHFYHWWDLARMREEPHASPLRRGPLLFNIWDSRAEGMATAMEEMMLHAGLYDDNPRGREVVWIMLAARAARGLASLYAQSNDFTMKQAADFHVEWTPRHWMRPDLDLLGFEQQLYLRQPGYGTSYITGKYLLEQLMAERSHQLGDAFTLSRYFTEMNAAGLIPVSLIHWEMTGKDDDIKRMLQ
jgi:uncharacterized protein (DUF885 family)